MPHRIPEKAWTPAYDADGRQRDGAWVAEVTDLVDLSAWPEETRMILRKERPHPGAQLRITDAEGLRITGMLTNTAGGQLAELELRHRRHARVEDRIRAAKDTGLRNLPFHDAAQNQIWLEICALAAELIAWTQRLALTGDHRIAEPRRLWLRIFAVAGRLVRTARRTILKIPQTWPWAEAITTAHHQLRTLTARPAVPVPTTRRKAHAPPRTPANGPFTMPTTTPATADGHNTPNQDQPLKIRKDRG